MLLAYFKKKKSFYLPLVIFLLAAGLRLWQLGKFPAFFNRDEASLAYNAYALLTTGREEHGQSWPINIESFGDWKLPGYVYMVMPFIAVFGLEPWAVRLPSCLAGLGIVILSYFLTRQFFGKKHEKLALLVMFLVSCNPWAIHFSRIAYEANVAQFFFLLGLLWLNFSRENNRSYRWLPLVAAAWVVAMLTYHAYQLFLPLLALAWLLLNWQEFWQKSRENKRPLFLTLAIGLLGIFILLAGHSQNANQIKFAGLSIFNKASYAESLTQDKLAFAQPVGLLAKLYSNNFMAISKQFVSNVYRSVAGQFLMIQGGGNHIHNISNVANYYFFEYPLLLTGFYWLCRHWRKEYWLLLAWFFFALLPADITFDPEHSTRLSALMVIGCLFIALGIQQLFSLVGQRTKQRWLLRLALLGLYSYALAYYVLSYFVVAPKKDLNGYEWYMKDLVHQVTAVQKQYQHIVMPFYKNTPYIYFLFYNKYSPTLLTSTLQYYPVDNEGFHYAKSLENIEFAPALNWQADAQNYQHILYVLEAKDIPTDIQQDSQYQLVGKISNSWAKTELLLLDFSREK